MPLLSFSFLSLFTKNGVGSGCISAQGPSAPPCTKTAQRTLVGQTGVFTNINVTAAPGVTDAQLKKNVVGELGTAYKVQTAKETADANQKDVEGFLDVMKYAMLGFAGIAFLVGIFLIINTFSMLVAQRTREIGLMRAIGSSRRQVNRSVLVEALLLGVVGSVLGVGAGVGIAVGLMKLMGSMGMHLSTSDLTVAWTTPVLGAPGYRIAGGSDEIQRTIIAERVLGLPREPR